MKSRLLPREIWWRRRKVMISNNMRQQTLNAQTFYCTFVTNYKLCFIYELLLIHFAGSVLCPSARWKSFPNIEIMYFYDSLQNAICWIFHWMGSVKSFHASTKSPVDKIFLGLRSASEWRRNNVKRKKGFMLKLTSNNLFISWDFFITNCFLFLSFSFVFVLRKECIIKQIFTSTAVASVHSSRVSFAQYVL